MRHRILLASALVVLAAAPALADRIDGHWCSPGGLRLTIAGPSITTPGGARIAGDYDRHNFAYTAPAGEPAAGTRVSMALMGEDTVRVQAPGLDPVWHRCGPPTS